MSSAALVDVGIAPLSPARITFSSHDAGNAQITGDVQTWYNGKYGDTANFHEVVIGGPRPTGATGVSHHNSLPVSGTDARTVVKAFEDTFGKVVVFFRSNKVVRLNAAAVEREPKLIFVNADSPSPVGTRCR